MNSNFLEAKIYNFCVHKVGNKVADEGCVLSKNTVVVNQELKKLLTHYFVSPFKSSEYFNFYHDIDINMNEVFVCASKIFANPETLLEQSVNLAKHLYEQSTHPKIKGGEFYTVYFKDCIIDGETVDAIGLFKSENKDTFLKVFPKGEGFEIESEKGININKLDKGCLIFNTERENGYIVAVVDNTNKGVEAQYWI
ncbi:MAG: nucleoid-associated protein, partial [Dysgonamonadaceae bacterium]|nr:nucleoid-associated protein [Dysgonamonadaceae bacterium]